VRVPKAKSASIAAVGAQRPQPARDPGHDHRSCEARCIDRARSALEAKGQKLTPLRLDVLSEVAGSHAALGAYDVLDRLEQKGRRVPPISVYRAIDALLDVGAVHRLVSRNAYFACHAGHVPGRRQVVLYCQACADVTEMERPDVFAALEATAQDRDFDVAGAVVEVAGLCRLCSSTARSHA
jgi:Fur family transcriptional regulator, zinc uptake regulator